MPWSLKRYQQSGQSHLLTFSCYLRQPLFTANSSKETFVDALERVRVSFSFCVYGYVVMPEHVHLLISEPERVALSVAIKSLKQGVSRQLIGAGKHFWQKRYYDFNIRDHEQFIEKLKYLHRNPVSRGLCALPEDWEWSSFSHYATGIEGRVEIESKWTAMKREREAGSVSANGEKPHSSEA